MKDNVFNILDVLVFRHAVNECKNKVAVIASGRTLTYSELSDNIRSLAGFLKFSEYTKEGDVIACLFDDSIESVICFFGLIHHGMVPCYLNPRMPIEAFAFYLHSVNTKYVLLSESYESKLSQALSDLDIKFETVKDNFFLGAKFGHPKNIEFTENSPLFYGYTSGTTGHPGAVMHRHKDVKLMNESYAKHILSVNKQDVLFTTSKMYFAYGLNCLFIALYHGGTAILSPGEICEEMVFSIFEHHNPTIFFSVPRIYRKLLHSEKNEKTYMPSLCISAGETLDAFIYNEWRNKYSIEIIDGIGATETLSTFISNVPGMSKAGCTGKVIQGFECDLRDAEGKSVEAGQHGVMWVKGETFHNEYLNNCEATKERFVDGWFKTNDIFYRDDDNFFYYIGRANELIYKNGVWVFPIRIESKINSVQGIVESVVTAYKSNRGDVLVIAIVEAENKLRLSEIAQNVIQTCAKEVFYREEEVNVVIFVNKLKKTFNEKIRRNGMLDGINRDFLDLLKCESPMVSAFDNQTGVRVNVN